MAGERGLFKELASALNQNKLVGYAMEGATTRQPSTNLIFKNASVNIICA